MAWLRRVEIVVTPNNDPSRQFSFNSHRIDFEVRSTIGWAGDTATVTLFNLSVEETKTLQNKNYGQLTIEIRAGYEDGLTQSGAVQRGTLSSGQGGVVNVANNILPTLFVGTVTNAVGYRRPPEHLTQLFCISKAMGYATDFTQMKAIPKGASLKDSIESMCFDYGFKSISTYGVGSELLLRKLPLGRTFHDTFLVEFRKLLGEYNLLFTITTGEVQIFSDTYGDKDAVNRMAKDREPIVTDVNKVIGNPIAGIGTYQLDMILDSNIQPGMVLDVSPLLGEELLANGVTSVNGPIVLNTDDSVFQYAMSDKYHIRDVVHFGSTHALEFRTRILALLGGNTAMGGNELVWQQMYANSAIASEPF